ncbi:hypothetical protein LB503_000028 [Fusarium chuoi]|nr:hypothetical protein LB503_000028 [Fusarium chuoi]
MAYLCICIHVAIAFCAFSALHFEQSRPTKSVRMKPLNLLIALIGLSINLVSATCFFTGAKWNNRTAARMHAFSACKGDGVNRGVFQVDFAAKQGITTCVQYSATQRFVFTIENLNVDRPPTKLDQDHCVGGLHHEILECARGGTSTAGQWRFR